VFISILIISGNGWGEPQPRVYLNAEIFIKEKTKTESIAIVDGSLRVYNASAEFMDFELTSNINQERKVIALFRDRILNDEFTLYFREDLTINDSPTRIPLRAWLDLDEIELNKSLFSVVIFKTENYSVINVTPQEGIERFGSNIYVRKKFVETRYPQYTEAYTGEVDITCMHRYDCDSDDVCNLECYQNKDPDCLIEATSTSPPSTTASSSSTTSTLSAPQEGGTDNITIYAAGLVVLVLVFFVVFSIKKKNKQSAKARERQKMIEWINKQLQEGEHPDKIRFVVESRGFEPGLVDYLERKL